MTGPAPRVSFEFFPPNSAAMERRLWASVERLSPLAPDFMSVTYGAGGSTRDRTHRLVSRMRRELGVRPAAHLTCVAASHTEVDQVARDYWADDIRHVVALRGDPPSGDDGFSAHPLGYGGSVELIAGLKRVADFEISAAAYPEPHPDSHGLDADLDHLKRKIDAGACRLITQYFFDNELFYRFRDRALAAGIAVPVVPGILPIGNFAQVVRFSARCGATVPDWLHARFDGLDDDAETQGHVAMAIAAEQCQALRAAGVEVFHFYTLNRSELVFALCHLFGVRAQAPVRPLNSPSIEG